MEDPRGSLGSLQQVDKYLQDLGHGLAKQQNDVPSAMERYRSSRCKVRRKSRARSTVTRQCKGLASGRLTQRAPPIYKASGTRPVLCRIV